ncbi:MAG: sulfotransferase [Alteromonadaceae bacterium]|nr:sulfotransferase [Alteromonadaceae bacterium]
MSSYPLPNLFIPGVQKAGTTALASFLSQHPDICLVKGKEAHVFDDPQYHRSTDKSGFVHDKYASKLAHYKGERYILDATPVTMLHPQFIQAAARHCAQAKYVVVLRDPVDRALSHYAMTKSRGLESRSPAMAFLLEPWRMRGFYKNLPNSPFESKYRDQSYLTRGKYRRQLGWLTNEVGESQIKIINQHDLLSNHQGVLDGIFDFLSAEHVKLDAERVFSTKDRAEISPFLYRILKWLV